MMRMAARLAPRLLPLLIAAMGLLAVLKLAGLMHGSGGPAMLASAGQAMVPAARAASGPKAEQKPDEAASPARASHGVSAATAPATNAPATNAPASTAPASTVPASTVPAAPGLQPPVVDAAELGLLQDLRSRRDTLDGRGRTLEAREAVLAAAERRLTERVEQLAALQARLEALDQTRRERDEANWRGLVKTYESMRPKDAAAILNDLEPAVLMQVLDRMKEAKAGSVLAAMQPDRARAATSDLVKWRVRALAGATP